MDENNANNINNDINLNSNRNNDVRGNANIERSENGGQGVRPRDGTRTNSGINADDRSRIPLNSLPIADTDRRTHSVSTAPVNVRSLSTSSSTHVRAVPATNSTFQIFSDHAVGENVPFVLTENSNWRNLDTQENKKKENSGDSFLDNFHVYEQYFILFYMT